MAKTKSKINNIYNIGEKLFEFSKTQDVIDYLQELVDEGYEDFYMDLELYDYSSGDLHCYVYRTNKVSAGNKT